MKLEGTEIHVQPAFFATVDFSAGPRSRGKGLPKEKAQGGCPEPSDWLVEGAGYEPTTFWLRGHAIIYFQDLYS